MRSPASKCLIFFIISAFLMINADKAAFCAASKLIPLANPLPPGSYTVSDTARRLPTNKIFYIGTAATDALLANLPSVTINGLVSGTNQSILQTNGANLFITAIDGPGHGSGAPELRAWAGNVTFTKDSNTADSNIIGILSVKKNMQIVSTHRMDVATNINMEPDSYVEVQNEYLDILGNLDRSTGVGMQPGAWLHSIPDINFRNLTGYSPTTGPGITNASGKISSEGNISAYIVYRQYTPTITDFTTNVGRSYDLRQGDGHLTLQAQKNILGRNISADEVSAGVDIMARNLNGKIIHAGNSIYVVDTLEGATGSEITAKNITAGTIKVDASGSATATNDITASVSITGAQYPRKTMFQRLRFTA